MSSNCTFCLYMPPLSGITTYKQMVDFAASHGITQLETLNILDLSTPDLQIAAELKAYAGEKGIGFPCVSMGLDLVDGDYEAALETAKGYVDVAQVLGSPYFHHTIALNYSDPQRIAENFDLFYQRGLHAVRTLFDYAASKGIRTIYEDQGFLFNGQQNFTRFLADVNRNVGIVADFGNIQFVDEDVENFIAAFADRIVHVHVKDYVVTPGAQRDILPGEYRSKGGNYLRDCLVDTGSVHTQTAFAALQAMDYHGSISLECNPFGTDEEASFLHNLHTIRSYMDRYL